MVQGPVPSYQLFIPGLQGNRYRNGATTLTNFCNNLRVFFISIEYKNKNAEHLFRIFKNTFLVISCSYIFI